MEKEKDAVVVEKVHVYILCLYASKCLDTKWKVGYIQTYITVCIVFCYF